MINKLPQEWKEIYKKVSGSRKGNRANRDVKCYKHPDYIKETKNAPVMFKSEFKYFLISY